MSTRAFIVVDLDHEKMGIYCHYDGYPEVMLPALKNVNEDELNNPPFGQIRGIDDDGTIEWYKDVTPATIHHVETIQQLQGYGADYIYFKQDGNWKYIQGI